MKPYYEQSGITIYHGDCREVLPHLAAVDAVVTDPPYPGYAKGWDVPDIGTILAAIVARVCVVCWPVLVPDPLPDPVATHVWHKPNGQSAHQYERVLVYGDAPSQCKVFRIAAILPNYTQYRHEAVDHPTQKPEALMRKLIGLYSRQGVVLDPFMGSGTTLVAAKRLGKQATGIEREERYCEIAATRLQQEVLSFELSSDGSAPTGGCVREGRLPIPGASITR